MSSQSTIDITFHKELNLSQIWDSLEASNWSFDDFGKITFLDNDDFEWKSNDLDGLDYVKNIIAKRLENTKISGIAIVDEQRKTGGLLHFISSKKLMFIININRLKVNEKSKVTDYSFYLEKLSLIIGETQTEDAPLRLIARHF